MKYFTTHEVAKMLQVDPATIGKWCDAGILVSHRTPGGHRRIAPPDLMAFVKEWEMPVPEELARTERSN